MKISPEIFNKIHLNISIDTNSMKKTMFCLSAKGLQKVNEELKQDFTLYINNNPIEVSKLIISFFSKKVFEALKLNPSLHSYKIYINNNEKIKEEQIKEIKNLIIGKTIEITKEKSRILETIGEELDNEELIEVCVEKILEGEEINVKNCIERIKRKERNHLKIEEEEEYIAKHFSEIEMKDLEGLDVKLLEKILNRKDLIIKTEEELIEKIKSLPKKI